MSFYKNQSEMFEERAKSSKKSADMYREKASNAKSSEEAQKLLNLSDKYLEGEKANLEKSRIHKGKSWK